VKPIGDFYSADFGAGLAEGAQVHVEPKANAAPAKVDDCALRLIGTSPSMQKVRDLIGRVAPTDSTVLICGESGCGKELVAESIHAMSPRAGKPFVAINCAAIPATLIEAELFGHERGSFTGAMRTREGVFERTIGGTLLLDEITEMPLDLQSRLLRVLETKRLSRVGGNSDLEVDVRVLASTNRSPAQAFAEGRLREDIYYRLAVVMVQLPPLRERGEGRAGARRVLPHRAQPAQRHAQTPVRGPARRFPAASLARQRARAAQCGGARLHPLRWRAQPERSRTCPPAPGTGGRRVATTISSRCRSARRSRKSSARSSSPRSSISRATSVARPDVLGCSLKTLYNKLHAYQRDRHAGMN
jgi:hypothetical protein